MHLIDDQENQLKKGKLQQDLNKKREMKRLTKSGDCRRKLMNMDNPHFLTPEEHPGEKQTHQSPNATSSPLHHPIHHSQQDQQIAREEKMIIKNTKSSQ